jgi:hypothetical protein
MFPDSCVKTPVPAASWNRLVAMNRLDVAAAALAAAVALLSGCLSQPCAGADDCHTGIDAGTKDAQAPDWAPAGPGPDMNVDSAPMIDSAPDAPAVQLPPPPATCEVNPAARHPAAPVHTFTVKPTFGAKAVELGEPTFSGAKVVTVTQLRFFVTQPVFLRAGADPMPAELVDAAGKPLPYGLALVDLEKPDSLTLRLRAPAGDFDRLSLSIGVYPACNTAAPAALVYPLNPSGGMSWIWTLGYIFVYLEGGKGAGVPTAFAAHAGIYPPGAGAVPLTATGSFGRSTVPTVLEARLDQLVDAVESENHIEGGMKLMARLPTADFWRVIGP